MRETIRLARSPWVWGAVALAVCLLPLCTQGYGSDNDSYSVLEAGVETWRNHGFATSRHPGYWLYEAVVYALSTIGGYTASNLGSWVAACLAAWRFYRIAMRIGAPKPAALTCCLIATPIVGIAATSTIDYMWSLLFLALAAESLFEDRLAWAAVTAGVAINFRPSNAVVVAGGFVAAMLVEALARPREPRQLGRLVFAALGASLFACATAALSYRAAGDSWSFLKPLLGSPEIWTAKMWVGRFFYKCLYALGPFAAIVCAVAAYRFWSDGLREQADPATSRRVAICGGFCGGGLILFARYPIDIGYLIPAVFFFLLTVGASWFRHSPQLVPALFLAILSLNFIRPEVARPNAANRATSAHLRPGLAPGEMLLDLHSRRAVIGCHDRSCWYAQSDWRNRPN